MKDNFLWKGRVKADFDREALSFSSSLKFDARLFEEDILNNIAHAKTLAKAGIITDDELKKIIEGLLILRDKYARGEIILNECEFEDVHSFIEFKLKEIIGDLAKKIHAGRSRNDQIVTDERLWLKKTCKELKRKISVLQKTLLLQAEKHIETKMPGYTHLQRAQAVSLAFHLTAYAEGFERDKKRFDFVFEESDECPLGSGALAGSTLALDRNLTAKELGFSRISQNAMDAVSDRDYFLDFLNACSICGLRLSRLCEDLFLWSTSEWNFVKLPEEFVTGSSLMPQKKNPDILELIRAKITRITSNYLNLSMIIKALPMAYCRDLQEDKPPVFESYDILSQSLELTARMIEKSMFNAKRFENEIHDSFMWATDLADYLVNKNVPFREAHATVANLVSWMEENNIRNKDLKINDLKKFSSLFENDALEIINYVKTIDNKKTLGSPNPEFLRKRICDLKEILNAD